MLSFSHMLLVLLVVLIFFGAGKLPKVMGDIGKGVKNLRDELNGDEKGKQEVLPPEDKK
ncbi:MAG: twin-arginine translocase TatA/TatE family subunit [Alphaproteobacteria bacterium]|nr:twin-arginine translocase TatA/TatE family subunit [Alphaproteobacteria bacterium]